MSSVLVLNVTHEPLSVVSVRRAIVLLLKDKAEILEATERYIRSAGLSLPVPSVIRLIYYVRVPYRMHVPLSRRTVLLRDNYTCQYCGATLSRSDATVDHVVPKALGGQNSWDNVVCACRRCNLRKGCKTLDQAKMQLRAKPERPQYLALVFFQMQGPTTWNKYIPKGRSQT